MEMKNEKRKIISKGEKGKGFPGYPKYSAKEDIYRNNIEEEDLDPEDPSVLKSPNENPDELNEMDYDDIESGIDLDVPGSELDDDDEGIGNEDEENNYYSIGGDNHNDLDENDTK